MNYEAWEGPRWGKSKKQEEEKKKKKKNEGGWE